MSRYFPLFIDLEKKKITVIGAGTIASRRIRTLLNFGAQITVLAPEASEEVRKLAEKEPCVIVGRCGDYVLEDREDCLHVFVHAPLEFKKERIIRLYGEREEKPEKRLEEKDKKRKLYYQHYTGRTWGMAKNYHLCLDSSLIGIDNCVDIIEKLAKGI